MWIEIETIPENGIDKIVEISLSDAEKAKLEESAAGVKKTNALLEGVIA